MCYYYYIVPPGDSIHLQDIDEEDGGEVDVTQRFNIDKWKSNDKAFIKVMADTADGKTGACMCMCI